MNKIAFALLLCLMPASWPRAVEAPAAEPSPIAKAVAAIKLKPNLEQIELWNDKPPRNYGLTLHYKLKTLVTSIAAVEADMKQITRAVLAELSRQGRKPAEKWVLLEEFMQPLGLSANALALALRVPATRIGDIIRTEKPGSVSADTALRLARYFGTSPEFWLNLQSA